RGGDTRPNLAAHELHLSRAAEDHLGPAVEPDLGAVRRAELAADSGLRANVGPQRHTPARGYRLPGLAQFTFDRAGRNGELYRRSFGRSGFHQIGRRFDPLGWRLLPRPEDHDGQ